MLPRSCVLCWWFVILAVIAAAAGCRRPATESTGFASLPRNAITTAQRAEWRMHLKWPDDCEDAFQASHAGDSGGILVVSLAPGVSLVEVICAAGSYQPSAMRFKVTEDAAGVRGTLLSFPWDPLESTCRHASLSIL